MTHFELFDKFQSFYKAGKNIYLTSDGFIIADDGENVNYINKKTLQKISQFNKSPEEITCFVANPDDGTVILAYKNLMLKSIDRSNLLQRSKMWNSCHKAPIFAMCLNKSSTRLTTGGADSKLRIFHLGEKEGKSFSCMFHKSKISLVKNHPTLNMVVSASILDHEIAAWNTETGKQLGIFTGHQNTVTGIDFHELSNQMATSSRDETVIIWNCQNFSKLFLIPVMESLETCVILRGFMNQPDVDEYLVMVGGVSGIIKTISPNKRAVIQEFKKASLFDNIQTDVQDNSDFKTIRSILQTKDSLIFVRESDNIEFYSKEMQLEYELPGDLCDVKDMVLLGKDKDLILAVEWAPYMRLFSGKSLEENDSDKSSVWPCQLIHGGHSKDITSVSAFNDGLRVVSGGKDGKVCIWQVEDSGRVRLKLIKSLIVENDIVTSVCVDPKGKFIFVSYSVTDCLVVLSFKNNKLKRKACFSKPHTNFISTMAISINSSLLATGSKDKNVKLWSYQSKTKEIVLKGVLKGHNKCISSVEFSVSQQLLLTASLDKDIKLWCLETLTCIQVIQSTSPVQKALFYNNEKQIISCHSDGNVIVQSRDKKSALESFNIHEEVINCLTLFTDSKSNCRGFVATGTSSMLCIYRDETENKVKNAKEEKDLQTQEQQELDNFMAEKRFVEALRFAIRLNKPLQTYGILSNIETNSKPIYEPFKADEWADKTDLGKAVKSLDLSEVRTLFNFCLKWITNNKTILMSQQVIGIMLNFIPNSTMLSWPEYVNNLSAIKAFTDRYGAQLREDLDSTGFTDYLLEVSLRFHHENDCVIIEDESEINNRKIASAVH